MLNYILKESINSFQSLSINSYDERYIDAIKNMEILMKLKK